MTEKKIGADAQYKRMTEEPIHVLIPKLAVPTMISMLVTAIYNTADTYFVSQLGKSASGAVGIVFSLMAIIQAVGFTIGMGAGSQISRLLGKKENERASQTAASAVINALIMGIIIAAVGITFTDKLMHLLGATDTILPYASAYAHYILLASPVMTICFVLNNLLRAEGKAKFSMLGILSGGVINLILDPILIFGFNMGIRGAAIATAISQLISLGILLVPFFRGKTVLGLSVKNISFRPGTYLGILRYGMPSLFRQGLASVASVLLNTSARAYGDSAIAAMSIVTKVFMMIYCVLIGFGQGYQPVVGYNNGAGNSKRVREAFWFSLKAGTLVMTVLAVITYIFTPDIVGAFLEGDEEVLAIGSGALRMQCLVMPLMTLGVLANMTFQAVGRSIIATILTSCRQGIFFIPLILVLPQIIGVQGIEMTQPIADVGTLLVAIPFMVRYLHGLEDISAEKGSSE